MRTKDLINIVSVSMAIMLPSLASANYFIGSTDIVLDVLRNSKEIKSLEKLLLSKKDLVEIEKKYFYPKVDIAVEYNKFYGKIPPPLDADNELTLGIKSKIYSDVSKTKISAADNNRLLALYNLKDKESELYFSVIGQLINIERSRMFLIESDAISEQMNSYISQISTAVSAGISPRSYLRETELIKARFNDVVATVKSDIDSYFTQLSLSTGYEIDEKNSIGIDDTFIKLILAEDIVFNSERAVKNNFSLLSKFHEVQGLKDLANSQYEMLKVTAFNDAKVGLKSNATNKSWEVRETSSVGVLFELKIFDFQSAKSKSASYNVFLSQQEIYDNEKKRMLIQIQELSENYATTKRKRISLLEQIQLSERLIETQEKEILIDRIEFIDMVKSLTELVQTHVTLLNNDIQLYDTVVSYRGLIAQRFN